jgi:hypothetical protein
MTPKEKAADLIDKMMLHYLSDMYGSHLVGIPEAKQCALICVEEIMSEQEFGTDHYYGRVDYWQQVKQEIKKL